MTNNVLPTRAELMRQYEIGIDLYKHYLKLVVELNVFYFAITGAIVSYYFSHKSEEMMRWSLALPCLMSLLFAALFVYGGIQQAAYRREIFKIRDVLGFGVAPEMLVLSMFLFIFALLMIFVSVGLGVLMFSGAPLVSQSAQIAVLDDLQQKGLLGDYVGGVWGTLIGALTLLAVLMTWRATRRTDYRSRTYQIFSEMLRSHEEIVSSIELNEAKGRDALAVLLSEFSFIYDLVDAESKKGRNWSLRNRIDIAYTFLFFGPQQQTQTILTKYGLEGLKEVADGISRERQVNEKRQPPRNDRTFKGHQNRLSQYFRNLFIAYRFLDESRLSKSEKRDLGKVLRAKLSNYEQALLSLNCLSHLGTAWMDTGLMKRYMPVKNIPQHFFSFDKEFSLKEQFSDVEFEWEQRA